MMARFTLIAVILFLLVASVLVAMGFQPVDSSSRQKALPPLQACRVLVVYDGDTFGCDLNRNHRIDASAEKIRMLGIDTTEMHYSPKNATGKDEPFALEAKQFVEARVLNKPVYLRYDQQRFDIYDRTLAYVFLDSAGKTMLNRRLLQEGLARTLFLGINRQYETDFNTLQRQAQRRHIHLWKTMP